jgi:membrane protease YdiL (CAAX protease family)
LTTNLLNWLLFGALLAAYLWYVRGGGVATGSGRIARYRRWMRRAPLAFGATSFAALLASGRLEALATLPDEFTQLAAHARHLAGFGGDIAALKFAVLAGFGGGVLLGLLIAWWRKHRGKRQLMAGNLTRILPQTPGEFGWTTILAVVAGIVEELFFRLALPLFATLASGSAELGFALAIALFAFAHRYQGRTGMAFSVIAGGLLAILYLATGSLWFTMLVHALLNLNGLVIRPALIGPARA